MERLGQCKGCNAFLVRWRTGKGFEGISGYECPNGCAFSRSIDFYPHDLQTQLFRKEISQKVETKKFSEHDWVKAEKEFAYLKEKK